MTNVLSTLSRRPKAAAFGVLVLAAIFVLNSNKAALKQHLKESLDVDAKEPLLPSQDSASKRREKKSKRVGVNARFFKQMQLLLPICIPGTFSKEAGLLTALAAVLIARTWLDIWFSGFNGAVVKAIVTRDRSKFIAKAIFEFGLMMWPMSIVNNCLKLTISALALSFRTRLTKVSRSAAASLVCPIPGIC
ncbi:ABC transporter transmembrane region 2-domain-containing protein [Jimgerdemannia flammicorona]|uniref:ABC transporter transmembrane region 2-domain-containing protein n=1 Tax=Jimgerdemannia flammicorona TaxID=994334 RepID=A0A433QHW5_9FUNG|nr:ABC transporter transmembrane region 2-domain-containing protein [Jimgerdemannia flammicorona]